MASFSKDQAGQTVLLALRSAQYLQEIPSFTILGFQTRLERSGTTLIIVRAQD